MSLYAHGNLVYNMLTSEKDFHTMTITSAKRFQRAFFRRAGKNAETLRSLAETLPGVRFNVVDDRDRIVAFNRENCANCNFRDEYEAVGQRIDKLFPPILANEYIKLYREVRRTSRPVLNRLTTHGADRSTTPRVASVFPVFDQSGKIIGTACFYRTLTEAGEASDWYGAVQRVVRYIDDHFAEKVSLTRLAAISRLSTATFRRAFARILEMTPGAYLTTIRINRARQLLAGTDMTIETIAAECGFYDQSHFVKTFRKLRHESPTDFRRRLRSAL